MFQEAGIDISFLAGKFVGYEFKYGSVREIDSDRDVARRTSEIARDSVNDSAVKRSDIGNRRQIMVIRAPTQGDYICNI